MRRFLFAGFNVACARAISAAFSIARAGHREWTFVWPSGGSRPHNDMSKKPRTDSNGRVFVSVRCPQTDMPSVFTSRASGAPTQAPGVMKWR